MRVLCFHVPPLAKFALFSSESQSETKLERRAMGVRAAILYSPKAIADAGSYHTDVGTFK